MLAVVIWSQVNRRITSIFSTMIWVARKFSRASRTEVVHQLSPPRSPPTITPITAIATRASTSVNAVVPVARLSPSVQPTFFIVYQCRQPHGLVDTGKPLCPCEENPTAVPQSDSEEGTQELRK